MAYILSGYCRGAGIYYRYRPVPFLKGPDKVEEALFCTEYNVFLNEECAMQVTVEDCRREEITSARPMDDRADSTDPCKTGDCTCHCTRPEGISTVTHAVLSAIG